jgi:hypothetical protein
VTRSSDARDFSDADVPTDTDPSPLRRLILAQAEAPGGAAVLLFGPATVTGTGPADGAGVDGTTVDTVRAVAAELGLGSATPDLFSPDAYLLQSALGERLLTPPQDRRAVRPVGDASGPAGTARPWTAVHSRALLASPLITLNYHDLAAEHRGEAEAMLRRVAALGPVFDLDDPAPGPRIVVGFYDSYRTAGLFGAELCDRLGIRATFFPLFAPSDEPGTSDLTDAELADIARTHDLGFHTASHVRADEITGANLEQEVLEPLRRLEAITGRVPRLAAWRGGARFDATRPGDAALRDAGVQAVMSNWSLELV